MIIRVSYEVFLQHIRTIFRVNTAVQQTNYRDPRAMESSM